MTRVVQALRFAAVLSVLAGYALVFRPGEARITAQNEENARLAAALADDERALRDARAVARLREKLAASIDVGNARAGAAQVPRFLRDASARGVAHRTAITAVIASGSRPAPGAPPPAASVPAVLDITLEGRYADVLTTIRRLSEGRVPSHVELQSVARKSASGSDPTVTATLHVTLGGADDASRQS